MKKTTWCLAGAVSGCLLIAQSEPQARGLFEDHSDVGTVLHVGTAAYDAASRTYTLTGSGENMWFAADDFQFVWKKVSDENVSLTADISLPDGGENHRKAVLMIRQSLDADSPYVDAARHGDGLTSLQFRDAKGGVTHEVQSNISAPERLRIAKRGDRFYMWVGGDGKELEFAGGSARVELHAPFYVGIGVCAHNKDAIQQAVFSKVDLDNTTAHDAPMRYSTLETVAVASTDARVSYVTPERIAAPEWSPDGASLIFRSGGRTQQVRIAGGTPETIQAAKPKNARTSLSPDRLQTAFLSVPGHATEKGNRDILLSVTSDAKKTTKVVAKFTGGRGTLAAHAWSPDGKRLAFVSYQSVSAK
ncbi:MAG TPA: hypothetical protein VGL97_22695 [Bryobacteraceae bacterium]